MIQSEPVVELPVGGGADEGVGDWRMLRGLADEGHGRGLDGGDARCVGADFKLGYAGDDEGWADGDEELVGAGGALGVDVGAADVGEASLRAQHGENDREQVNIGCFTGFLAVHGAP